MGHVARMPSTRLPKQVTFAWLPEQPALPQSATWRHANQTRRVLRCLGIDPTRWFDEAQDRAHWAAVTQSGPWSPTPQPIGSRPSSSRRTRGTAVNEQSKGEDLIVACPYPGCPQIFTGIRAPGNVANHYASTHRTRSSETSVDLWLGD